MFCQSCCLFKENERSVVKDLHSKLCHPGVSRLLHYVRARNLLLTTSDVRYVRSSCRICAELKPRFYRPPSGTLIKATKAMERLSNGYYTPNRSKNGHFLRHYL
ncbi:unnamed protein product [Lepeophtheirus salmonis]|uniref:(salmon louse) hypothetical protein n=1 Tax=Lepeophtheirus salmonis TaxID=72036 RepID=A0A7R8CW47_LEPSM|nr:unnamed protein product [Lepeophtheirus salmonis]CAF2950267.1 unnamed protein product [Lepeophtheirus salmonis]